MKNLLASFAMIATFSTAANAAGLNSTVTVHGASAIELSDVLKIDNTAPKIQGPAGINPLHSFKSLKVGKASVSCEIRLFSATCSITAVAADDHIYVTGEAADALYAALDVEVQGEEAGPTGGINPLFGAKTFESSDASLIINCEQRLFGHSCSIVVAK